MLAFTSIICFNHIINIHNKGGISTIHDKILNEYNILTSQINSLKAKLKQLPEGKLLCAKSKNSYKWYNSDGHTKTYIPKKERQFASKLATRKYLSYLLEDLIHERNALAMYLRHHQTDCGKAEHLLFNDPECHRLMSDYFTPLSKELANWANEPYKSNPYHPEALVHINASGKAFRSKSELIIDSCLSSHQIPNRYECELVLNNCIVYPDFTIRHPRTGNIYYYEHFGRIDEPLYAQRACTKLQNYFLSGIYPTTQLIITYESPNHPLTPKRVEHLIEEYFL